MVRNFKTGSERPSIKPELINKIGQLTDEKWLMEDAGQVGRILNVCRYHAINLEQCADILEFAAPIVDEISSYGFILRAKQLFKKYLDSNYWWKR